MAAAHVGSLPPMVATETRVPVVENGYRNVPICARIQRRMNRIKAEDWCCGGWSARCVNALMPHKGSGVHVDGIGASHFYAYDYEAGALTMFRIDQVVGQREPISRRLRCPQGINRARW